MKIETTADFPEDRAAILERFRKLPRIERVLARQGVKATLKQEQPVPVWDCAIVWRDAPREFTLTMTEPAPHETIRMAVASKLADVDITYDFYDLPEGQTRIVTQVEIGAHSVMVKLALQSMRLVRGAAEERVERLTRAFARKPEKAA